MSEAQILKAVFFFRQNRFEEAEKELYQLLGQDPNSIDGLGLLARCQIKLDKNDEALATIRQALSLSPDDDRLIFQHARVLYLVDRFEEAIAQIESAIRLNPAEAIYFGLLADIKLHMKKYEEALANADKGLALDPEDSFCLNTRASALIKLKRPNDAFDTIATSLENDPENSFTHTNFGWSKLETGQHKAALEHFREALRLNPNNEYAQAGMVEAIKAKNLFYRLFLRYVFWMNRMSSKYQWGFIIGIYLLFRVLQGLAESNPMLQPFLMPLVYTYLVFALSTWFMEPLANLFLLVNPYGRFALSKKERLSAMLVGLSLAFSIVSIIVYLSSKNEAFMATAFFFFGMMIPLASMFKPAKPKARKRLIAYAIGLAAVGILALIPMWLNGILIVNVFATIFLGGLFIYQWVANANIGPKY